MGLYGSKKYIMDYKILLILILFIIVMAIISPYFLTLNNIINILAQISIYGVVGCAMTIAIICGEFDLSVGSTLGLGSVLFILIGQKFGIVLAIVVVLLSGITIGLINGFLVSIAKINSFIVTLGTMIAVKGVSMTVSNGKPLQWINDTLFHFGNEGVFGLPYLVIILLLSIAVTEYILKKTTFGRNIFATGGNIEVANYSGINVKFYKLVIFVILGVSAALAGILLACRMSAGLGIYGEDLPLYAVAAVVIGGTSLSGGRGSAVKTLFGLLFMGILFNALNMLNVYAYFQLFIRGLIVILVVILDRCTRDLKNR